MKLYDFLARGSGFPSAKWVDANQLRQWFPELAVQGLAGGYVYWDGQMDDYRLGIWAAEKAREAGVKIFENTRVERVGTDGAVSTEATQYYDRVVNAAGPWAEHLLHRSGISAAYGLNLIRGTHLVISRRVRMGCVLQVPSEKRLVFLLPYGENALLGTTEVPQPMSDQVAPSESEITYLLACYNAFFADKIGPHNVVRSFAGLRPVVASKDNYSSASRESVIERQHRLINVFGGKWTTSHALAKKIVKASLN